MGDRPPYPETHDRDDVGADPDSNEGTPRGAIAIAIVVVVLVLLFVFLHLSGAIGPGLHS